MPWDVMVGTVMVLTASCWIDKQRDEAERLCLVAPVVAVDQMEWRPADLAMLRDQDCLHPYMFLPAESEWPERVVKFLDAQPIRYSLLNRCRRQTQLTYTANQQLMRKLALFFSTAHVPAVQFRPMSDDFPGDTRNT
jgi:hypothetical protein